MARGTRAERGGTGSAQARGGTRSGVNLRGLRRPGRERKESLCSTGWSSGVLFFDRRCEQDSGFLKGRRRAGASSDGIEAPHRAAPGLLRCGTYAGYARAHYRATIGAGRCGMEFTEGTNPGSGAAEKWAGSLCVAPCQQRPWGTALDAPAAPSPLGLCIVS